MRFRLMMASALLGAAGLVCEAAPAFSQAAVTPQAKHEAAVLNTLPPKPVPRLKHPPIDHSGRKESGRASYYSRKFDGRKMANGRRFNPHADIAASKTLPLGTTAQVVNLNTGKSAVVTVQDRGPHVKGRVMDVSPKVASKLDLRKSGVAPVIVKPIAVPQPDGRVKLGAGAATLPPHEVAREVRRTEEIAKQ